MEMHLLNLEDILNDWKKDCVIDESHLDKSSIDSLWNASQYDSLVES